MSELLSKFETEGYVIVDLNDDHVDFKKIRHDMDRINAGQDKKLNPKIYHYNEFPRLIEGWKKSESIKSLALHPNILAVLSELYKSKAIAFSTINYIVAIQTIN